MFIAENKETHKRIYIDDAINNEKNEEYICPVCGSKLIVRNGSINIPHFAHVRNNHCDSFSSDISKWHLDWQNVFPKGNQEVVMSFDISEHDYIIAGYEYRFSDQLENELGCSSFSADFFEKKMEYIKEPSKMMHIKHRADVLACGYVIEFQHSPISSSEFNERNWFYMLCGKKVIWIFDFIEEYNDGQIICYDEWSSSNDKGGKYKWKYSSKTFNSFVPQDQNNVTVFFQLFNELNDAEDSLIEKVTWCIPDDVGFKRFCTSYYPTNKTEFRDWIEKRKL